jgi:hypothetical protein
MPMKTPLSIALLVCLTHAAYGQTNSDDRLKSLANRVSETYGVSIDPATTSLDDLIDLERRLKLAKQIKDAYGIDVDYRKYSDRQLDDIAIRVREVARINRVHGLNLDRQQFAFEKLVDADSRIQLANRIKVKFGESLQWQDFSLSEMLDAQARMSAGQWARPKKRASENDELSAALRQAEILIRQRWAEPAEVDGRMLGAISGRYGPSGSARTYDFGAPPISTGYYDRYVDPTYRPSVGYHWVSPYFRNGSLVRGHFQTNPDSSFWNNWSSKRNINPFTGRVGTKIPSSSHHGGGRGR